MGSVQFHDGKVLFVGGKVAMHPDCCCDELPTCYKTSCGCCYSTDTKEKLVLPILTCGSDEAAVGTEPDYWSQDQIDWVRKIYDLYDPLAGTDILQTQINTPQSLGTFEHGGNTYTAYLLVSLLSTANFCEFEIKISLYAEGPSPGSYGPTPQYTALRTITGNCCGQALPTWTPDRAWQLYDATASRWIVYDNRCCKDSNGDCQPRTTEQCADHTSSGDCAETLGVQATGCAGCGGESAVNLTGDPAAIDELLRNV